MTLVQIMNLSCGAFETVMLSCASLKRVLC